MTRTCRPSAPGEPSRLQQFIEYNAAVEAFREVVSGHLLGAEWISAQWPRSESREVGASEVALCAPAPQPFDLIAVSVLEEESDEAADFVAVLRHYSRRLDSRVFYPILGAGSREAAFEIVRAQWSWFVRTITAMSKIFVDSSASQQAQETSARAEIVAAARQLGDTDGEEIEFILSTFAASDAMAASIVTPVPDELRQQDSANWAAFISYRNLYCLGVTLLRSSPWAPQVTPAGAALALELARMGALHAYAHARQAIELRKGPEPQYAPEDMSEEEYKLVLAS
jgi:hypothetical protein